MVHDPEPIVESEFLRRVKTDDIMSVLTLHRQIIGWEGCLRIGKHQILSQGEGKKPSQRTSVSLKAVEASDKSKA